MVSWVFTYLYRQKLRPTNGRSRLKYVLLHVQVEQNPVINDLYDVSPATLQGTYIIIDTIFHYFILCWKLGYCILLVKLSL